MQLRNPCVIFKVLIFLAKFRKREYRWFFQILLDRRFLMYPQELGQLLNLQWHVHLPFWLPLVLPPSLSCDHFSDLMNCLPSWNYAYPHNKFREAMGKILARGHSRVPVYSGNPRNIIGLLLVGGECNIFLQCIFIPSLRYQLLHD